MLGLGGGMEEVEEACVVGGHDQVIVGESDEMRSARGRWYDRLAASMDEVHDKVTLAINRPRSRTIRQ